MENLGVSMDGASGVLSAEKEDPISSHNSATGDTPDQDTKSNDDGQEKVCMIVSEGFWKSTRLIILRNSFVYF